MYDVTYNNPYILFIEEKTQHALCTTTSVSEIVDMNSCDLEHRVTFCEN